MKVYIRAVSIEDLRKKYPKIPDPKFKELINIDPTADYDSNKRGKYMPWVLKQYELGNLTPDTYSTVTDTLADLADPVRKRAYQEKDVNKFTTVQDLIDAHTAAMNTEVELTRRQRQRNAHREARQALAGENEGAFTLVASDGDWEVFKPNNQAGDIALAMVGVDTSKPYTRAAGASPDNLKAEWCTAAEGSYGQHYYDSYTSRGPLYVFINRKDPINKYQTCIYANGGGEWMFDKNDRQQGKQFFLDFCAEHPSIGEYFRVRDEGGVLIMADSIQSYNQNATEITIPDGVTTLPNFKFPSACTKVTLPDSITTINSGAFSDSNVEQVIFNNVTTIERNAFKDSAIADIDLSKVTFIGSSAFRNCQNLVAVGVRSDATVQAYAFAGCSLNGTITQVPETVLSPCAYDNNVDLTVIWDDDDYPYAFHNIKELVVDMATHPQLVEANRKSGVTIVDE